VYVSIAVASVCERLAREHPLEGLGADQALRIGAEEWRSNALASVSVAVFQPCGSPPHPLWGGGSTGRRLDQVAVSSESSLKGDADTLRVERPAINVRRISVSRWYAGRIREGYRPHPRHWEVLAELAGVVLGGKNLPKA
jgi:hypothetical protein